MWTINSPQLIATTNCGCLILLVFVVPSSVVVGCRLSSCGSGSVACPCTEASPRSLELLFNNKKLHNQFCTINSGQLILRNLLSTMSVEKLSTILPVNVHNYLWTVLWTINCPQFIVHKCGELVVCN